MKQNVTKTNDIDEKPTQEPMEDDAVVEESHEQILKEIEEYKQKYLRALADYQNLEKRSVAEKEEVRKFAAEVTLRKFLPAIDNLQRAADHIDDEGFLLALKDLESALAASSVKKMSVVGKAFDPFTMECIEVVEGENGIVVEELTPGYTFFEKVLRVAQVKVGKGM